MLQSQFVQLAEAIKRDAAQDDAGVQRRSIEGIAADGEAHGHSLEKRQGKAAMALLPSMSTSGVLAIGAGALITAIYLHSIHEKKEKALMQQWNSQYHSAGEAASAVGNAIATGANGQLFNPLTGSLVLVDPNTNLYYDSGTGEQVNPKTGMPFRYGSGENDSTGDASKNAAAPAQENQPPPQLPLDNTGNIQGESPEVQKALERWKTMSPQQQQQLVAQYGPAAEQILDSPNPQAAFEAWSSQSDQPQQSSQYATSQQQQQFAPQQPPQYSPTQQQTGAAYGSSYGAGDTGAGSGL